ncbi:MAG: hypothetical protein JJT76_14605 [Clostridiaceae bacterium]|nr:hypothetical protein [Clostridiaceae bacterium]
MNKEFKDLIEKYDNKYKGYVKNNDLEDSILSFVEIEQVQEREFKMAELIKYIENNSEKSNIINKLTNPYFVGFGNPNADILFLGQEKAFNADERLDLLFKESVNNLFQWKNVIQKSNAINWNEIIAEDNFSPLLPNRFHKVKNHNHTWGIYSKILSGIYKSDLGKWKDLLCEHEDWQNSLFNYAFLSELNYIPSKKNTGRDIDEIRKPFLSEDFFKRFPIIIIGSAKYMSEIELIKNIFNVSYIETFKLQDKYTFDKYQSDNNMVLVTKQLSGSCGWSNNALEDLSIMLRQYLERRNLIK